MKKYLILLLICLSNKAFAQSNWGYDVKNSDKTCEPCENFYKYVNGGWQAKNPVPDEYPRYGMFTKLSVGNLEAMKSILETLGAKQNVVGSSDQKIADLYKSALDTIAIENQFKNKNHIFWKELNAVSKIKNLKGIQAFIAKAQQSGLSWPFVFYVDADAKNSNVNVGSLYQSGFNLPEKNYYTDTDSKTLEIVEAYKVYISNMFVYIGESRVNADAKAIKIIELEKKLATASLSRIDMRDPESMYNVYDLKKLSTLSSNFNFKKYFSVLKVNHGNRIIVAQPKYFEYLNKFLKEESIYNIKLLIQYNLLADASTVLNKDFVLNDFQFKSKKLQGAKKMQPRWKFAVNLVDNSLGDALGKVYVEKYFPQSSKNKMLDLVKNLKIAFKEQLETLPWMSDSTRTNALKKLSTFTTKIGYPDKWKDYNNVSITANDLYANMVSIGISELRRNIDKLGKPVDKSEWGMTPATVNAYYNPSYNEIVFPAGILQPPFFDPNADDAINYGAIGGVIGHEITHGFDDQGAQFDADGNLKNWFSTRDLETFKSKSECVVKQFDNIKAVDTLKLNGELVVGESIADLGGIKMAYNAYKNVTKNKAVPILDGFTGDQRFFIGWAQVWCSNEREEYLRYQINNDYHPISRERVNAPLSNLEIFRNAFGCKPGQRMNNSDNGQCELW